MATVVRIKRRITEEQIDKFIVKCKRRKTDADGYTEVAPSLLESAEETSTILKLAATVQSEDAIKEQIHRLTKSEAEDSVRKVPKPANVTAKSRQQLKIDSQNSRFKVVNCYRSIDEASGTEAVPLTVVNVVRDVQEKASAEPMAEAKEEDPQKDPSMPAMETDFVYDLYLVDGSQNMEIDYDNLISIHPFDDLVYQATDDTFDDSDGSENSNDEGNWRNDYPDTDEDFSIGEDDMRRAVQDLNLGSDDNLSSDESDYAKEPTVHFLDAGSDSDEYAYFKKNGQMHSHKSFYRNGRSTRPAPKTAESDSESDGGSEADNEDS